VHNGWIGRWVSGHGARKEVTYTVLAVQPGLMALQPCFADTAMLDAQVFNNTSFCIPDACVKLITPIQSNFALLDKVMHNIHNAAVNN